MRMASASEARESQKFRASTAATSGGTNRRRIMERHRWSGTDTSGSLKRALGPESDAGSGA